MAGLSRKGEISLKLYDTARQQVLEFNAPKRVRIYTCGITPYDATHVGHAFVFLTFDVLRRRLVDMGHETICVRNVTDVDDDILRKARELGVHYLDLAAEEIARFNADMKSLNVIPVTSEPRATSAISDILKLIGIVLENGYGYISGGGVYFRTSKFASFGSISHLDRATMLSLAAERGGNLEDPNKEDPLDFVLWQPSLDDEPSWESRWGRGRPGWHIECSALALRELGSTIDIHGGGTDLIFPHHECESAQSEVATGERFVRFWMHVAMVGYQGEKMSKSLGNLVFVSELLKSWDPNVIRLAVLSHHYRKAWEWTDDELQKAQIRFDSWKSSGIGTGAIEEVRNCLDEDLNVPGALEVLDQVAASGVGVSKAAELLGVIL